MSEPVVVVRDLHVHFRGHGRVVHAVKGVDLDVARGEIVAIVGESGSGKSATVMSIPRLLREPPAHVRAGRVVLAGIDLTDGDRATLLRVRGSKVGVVFQEPTTSLDPVHTVGRQIAEAIRVHRPDADVRREVEALLARVGLGDIPDIAARYPHQLSGGQRQRVMIAIAVANRPDLLIADEPTTALDVTVQKRILDLVASLRDETGMAVLFVTHDLHLARRLADRVLVMKDGVFVEQGRAEDVLRAPRHPYTRELVEAIPRDPPPRPPSGGTVVAETRGVNVVYRRRGFLRSEVSSVHALRDFHVALREGTTTALVGESGSGKTTAAMALLRLLEEAEGTIVWFGQRVDGLPRRKLRALRRRAQVVFQDPFGSLDPRMTVGEIVGEGLAIHRIGRDRRERTDMVARALHEVGLPEDALSRYPHEFSGGQRQRIAIARAMVLEPRFVVLDEPTSALDVTVQAQIVHLLRRLQRDHGTAYLFVSHDLRVVRALAHTTVVMAGGRVVEAGPTADVLERPVSPVTRELVEAAFPEAASETQLDRPAPVQQRDAP